jgi:membrane protease YdiL (CAAX protease family)
MDDGIAGKATTAGESGSPSGWVLIEAPILAAVFAIVASFVLLLLAAPTHTQVQQYARAFVTNYYAQLGSTIFVYFATFVAIWLLLPKRGAASLQSYFGSVSWRTVALALASGVGFAFLVGVTLTMLADWHVVSFHETRAERALIPHDPRQLGIALAAIAIVGPIVEEIYFRGLLLRWLRAKMPLALAAVPNAALFAATHFRFATHIGAEGWVLTGGLFVFGLFAVAWASATRSLWPSIAAHGMYNATLIGAPLLAQH